jgi:glycosyltransferase involved in cell wall biosynthesis
MGLDTIIEDKSPTKEDKPPTKEETNPVRHVVLCGTHPSQYNGYSKVVYEIAWAMSKYADIKLYIFGFQNFYDKADHKNERLLPENVEVFDAYKNEEPKGKGFGDTLIVDYVKRIDPDIVIIYNDLVVITTLINKLQEIKNPRYKLVPYIDLVYKNEKNNLIKNICEKVDGGILFTDYWQDIIKYQGFNKRTDVLPHGFNKMNYYPIPKKITRKFFNIKDDDFVVVNLNRNQPRKRWDICIMAFVKFMSLKDYMSKPIKLMIATGINGGWDLIDMMISECRKHGIDFDEFKQHLIILQNPQQISDREINVMYNVGDIGINTCDGEGFGLCNFEQAGVGIPQIVPKIGGFRDFLTKQTAIMVTPKWSYYCDHSRDFVAGEAEVCDVDDYVQALELYYNNPKIREKHGRKARRHILEKYAWGDIVSHLHKIITDYTKGNAPRVATVVKDNDEMKIDINALIESKIKTMSSFNNSNSGNSGNSGNGGASAGDDDDDIEIIEGGG